MNSPENTVISGRAPVVRSVLAQLDAEGIRSQTLTVSHAFHSPLIEPMIDAFRNAAAAIQFHQPRIPIISNLTGLPMGDATPGVDYWADHIRGTVRFAHGVESLRALDVEAVVEVGPTPTLISLARRCAPDWSVAWLPTLRRGQSDWNVVLASLAELYLRGSTVNWRGFMGQRQFRRVSLPTYPFERTRHWFQLTEGRPGLTSLVTGRGVHPLLGQRVSLH